MKIKAVDIARKLDLSKATVSLALNNKPGVSEQTRQAVLQCITELKEERKQKIKRMIMVIYVKRDLSKNAEMDLDTDVRIGLDNAARQMGYTLGVVYADMENGELDQAIQDANAENVAGVVCAATEFLPEEMEILKRIKKPLAIFDNDAGGNYHCSVIGNMEAVRDTVDMLAKRGCQTIQYLGNSVDIYNFRERRAGFRAGLRKNNLELRENSILSVGKTTQEVYEYMMDYLQKNKLPDAFIMDNYQVSAGVMRAVRELQIQVPQEVSLVGVDELPSFILSDYQLTTVKVQHAERAQALLLLLDQEIHGKLNSKFKLVSHCELLLGNSVR